MLSSNSAVCCGVFRLEFFYKMCYHGQNRRELAEMNPPLITVRVTFCGSGIECTPRFWYVSTVFT